MRKLNILTIGLSMMAGVVMSGSAAMAAGAGGTITERDWSFNGPFGHFDKASLQRGFQVYREVCAGCHGLDYIAFRNLSDLGYNEAEIKAIAAEYDVVDGPNEEGEMFTRAGIPADRFPNPYPNENAARAGNGGAYPPDLSLMVKARPNGANYLYSLMVGYKDAPEGTEVPDGMHYNDAYSGHMIAMPQPIYGDDITLAGDGDTSIEALSADVTTFLAWASEPEMESRKRTGIAAMLFLLVMCFVSYGSMRYVWSDVKK
ncbi:MAG: cytochrome c1 [Alphaproteobacteria bacterium]|nr:cytochrome c1 [Alphaproteobacteria bacterium]